MRASVVSARRFLVIGSATVATIVAVGALLFIPLSIAVGKPQNAIVELALLVVCVWWVARVMRTDRRRRLAEEPTEQEVLAVVFEERLAADDTYPVAHPRAEQRPDAVDDQDHR